MNTILSFRTHVRNLILSFFHSVIPMSRSSEQSVWGHVRNLFFSLSLRGHVVTAAIYFFFALPSLAFAEKNIPVFPTSPVEAYTVYATVALLWIGIIWLIVIIKMKLNEIERIQKLGIDKENSKAPILD